MKCYKVTPATEEVISRLNELNIFFTHDDMFVPAGLQNPTILFANISDDNLPIVRELATIRDPVRAKPDGRWYFDGHENQGEIVLYGPYSTEMQARVGFAHWISF